MVGSLGGRSAVAVLERDALLLARWRARCVRWFAVTAAVVISAAACGGSSSNAQPTAATSTPSASVAASSSPPATQAVILGQYREFWAHLTPASKSRPSDRRGLLSRYATDPELSSLLRGMATADSKGQVFYGANEPRPKLLRLSLTGGVAVVDDCQDSSHAGLASGDTKQPITVGVRRNHVVATMHRASDGTWLVAFVSYARTTC